MANYHPPQQTLIARVYTATGVVRGTFHLPAQGGFADYLSRNAFWNLTDVSLPGHAGLVPFFSLRGAAAALVIPEQEVSEPSARAERRRVACLLRVGAVVGDVEIIRGSRVSDFASHRGGFFVLRDAEIAGVADRAPIALVNADALMGVSEEAAGELAAEALTQQRQIWKA